jgi:LUD domain
LVRRRRADLRKPENNQGKEIMDIAQIKYREKLAEQLIKNLSKRRMEASYAPTAAQARNEIVAIIPAGATVSRCGSMSLVEMGFWEEVAKIPGVEVIDPFVPGIAAEEAYSRRRRCWPIL